MQSSESQFALRSSYSQGRIFLHGVQGPFYTTAATTIQDLEVRVQRLVRKHEEIGNRRPVCVYIKTFFRFDGKGGAIIV